MVLIENCQFYGYRNNSPTLIGLFYGPSMIYLNKCMFYHNWNIIALWVKTRSTIDKYTKVVIANTTVLSLVSIYPGDHKHGFLRLDTVDLH